MNHRRRGGDKGTRSIAPSVAATWHVRNYRCATRVRCTPIVRMQTMQHVTYASYVHLPPGVCNSETAGLVLFLHWSHTPLLLLWTVLFPTTCTSHPVHSHCVHQLTFAIPSSNAWPYTIIHAVQCTLLHAIYFFSLLRLAPTMLSICLVCVCDWPILQYAHIFPSDWKVWNSSLRQFSLKHHRVSVMLNNTLQWLSNYHLSINY